MADLHQQDLDRLRSIEELLSHREACVYRVQAIDEESRGLPFEQAQRDEFVSLKEMVDEIDKRVEELRAREAIRDKLNESGSVEEPSAEVASTSWHAVGPTTEAEPTLRGARIMPNRLPANVFALDEYRSVARNTEDLRDLYRSGALKILDTLNFGERTRKEATQDHVEQLIGGAGEAAAEMARRVIHTANPLYDRAFGKYVMGRARSPEEERVLSVGGSAGADGGYAVPFTLDTTLILTEDVPVSPLRRIARNITITTTEWKGVSADGVDVAYQAELTEVTESEPTLAQPVIATEKAQGYVEFSIEIDQDWAALRTELGRAFNEAKTSKEADKFMNGAGHGSHEPEGLLTGATTAYRTAANNAFTDDDLIGFVNSLPERYQGQATILGSRYLFGLVRLFDTAGGGSFWTDFRTGVPQGLVGYPIEPGTGFDTAIAASNQLAVIGDFSKFVIVDRAGMNVELIPHVLGSNRRPLGARAIYVWFRNSSGVVDANAFRVLTVKT